MGLGRRDLAAEAKTLKHLMTHMPKNPHCLSCQRAKLQKAPNRRTHPQEEDLPKSFGEQVTADHIIMGSERSEGESGEKLPSL